MNKVFLKGNLTRDPETRDIPLGDKSTTVANFTVAVSRYYKKKDGETEQATEYLDCEAWDSGAVTIGKILHKGDPVLVEGSLKKESWEDKEGNKRSRVKVRVEKFEKLFRKPQTDDAPAQTAETVEVGAGDDIDF